MTNETYVYEYNRSFFGFTANSKSLETAREIAHMLHEIYFPQGSLEKVHHTNLTSRKKNISYDTSNATGGMHVEIRYGALLQANVAVNIRLQRHDKTLEILLNQYDFKPRNHDAVQQVGKYARPLAG